MITGKLALSLTSVPVLGAVLAQAFCWGHPLKVLGQGMFLLGPVVAGIAAIAAVRNASQRGFALAALCVSALEVLGVLALLALAL